MTSVHDSAVDENGIWQARRFGTGAESRPFRGESSDAAYQRDRARVIHSSAFRSLQGKTQILKLGEGDFYRTRLTHSLEVAQIASGIAAHLREKYCEEAAVSLIEAVGLAHDIGHPPFGHGGEAALNHHMRSRGGFEGNGQTLRIASRLGEYSPSEGLDLTRRTLLGLVKYPALHRDLAVYEETAAGADNPLNLEGSRPPKCVLDDEAPVLDWILEPLSLSDREAFQAAVKVLGRHGRTIHRSFDASVMDLADDIAYGVHDFEDTLALRLVSFRQWQEAVAEQAAGLGDGELHARIDFYNAKLFSGDDRERKHAVSRLVHYFISNIHVEEKNGLEAPLLRYNAAMARPALDELLLLKDFVFRHVISSPAVQAAEFKGQQMLLKLFEVLVENAARLLPADLAARYAAQDTPHRMVADYLAGLTDAGVARSWSNLFSPQAGWAGKWGG